MNKNKNFIHRLIFSFILVAAVNGCNGQPNNVQFEVRISGDSNALVYAGKCTAQKAGIFRKSIAQGIDIIGTIPTVEQEHNYEISGFFIYCSIANQSSKGVLTAELFQNGELVASANSSNPENPAFLEFGQKP